MSRFIRQLIYGLFYLGVLSAIGYGIYSANLFAAPTCVDGRLNQGEEEADCGGPNCASCELKKLQPVTASAQFFGIDSVTNAVLTFSNPNLNYGAQSFTYTLNFYNQTGQNIFSLTKLSFIYPAEAQKVVVEPNLRVNAREISGSAEITVGNLNWIPAGEFAEPSIQTRQTKTEISGMTATVTGILANREAFALSRVTIGAIVNRIVSESAVQPAGASKTILQNLKPFEERAFKITVPLSAALKLSQTETILTTESQK